MHLPHLGGVPHVQHYPGLKFLWDEEEGDVGTFPKKIISWRLHPSLIQLEWRTEFESPNGGVCAEYAFLGFFFKYERRSPMAFGEDFEHFPLPSSRW